MFRRLFLVSFLFLVIGSIVAAPSLAMGNTPRVAGAAGVIMVPGDYATIQEAVNAANPDDTIMVGDYAGAGAQIAKPVNIMGSGANTVINAPGWVHPTLTYKIFCN